jgi:hypothetical protein
MAIGRNRILVVGLVLLGWAAAAHAEDAGQLFVWALVRETRGKALEQM